MSIDIKGFGDAPIKTEGYISIGKCPNLTEFLNDTKSKYLNKFANTVREEMKKCLRYEASRRYKLEFREKTYRLALEEIDSNTDSREYPSVRAHQALEEAEKGDTGY